MALAFGIGSPVVGWLCSVCDPLKCVLIALIISPIATSMVGPSVLLGIPDKIPIIIIGLALQGLTGAGVLVPAIPIMIGAGIDKVKA